MGMIDRLRAALTPVPVERGVMWPGEWLNFGGRGYPITLNQTLTGNREAPDPGYSGLVVWAYQSDPIVYACMNRRAQLFTEARFQWRNVRNGRPGDLYGTKGLDILETPWLNGTTGDLLGGMIQDHDLAGNAYIARRGGDVLKRLRPDWVTIISGSNSSAWDIDAKVIGYGFQPGGPGSGRPPIILLPEQVAHFKASPDPLSPWRGMSWLTPVLREIGADRAATEHKARFFENGATPNMVVSFDPTIPKATIDAYAEAVRNGQEGAANAYRTMFLGSGAKIEVVGKDLQQLDFKVTQGAGETRIAAAAGVPPAVAGFSEGLQGSSLNAGNFSAAMRLFADLTIAPLWRNACASLSPIVNVPGGAELWYDSRDIPALRENMLDAADVQTKQAVAIRQYIDAGFEPDSVVDAVTAGDLKRLKHSGLYSVQLQPPQPEGSPEPEPGAIPEQLKPFVAAMPDMKPADGTEPVAPAKAGS